MSVRRRRALRKNLQRLESARARASTQDRAGFVTTPLEGADAPGDEALLLRRLRVVAERLSGLPPGRRALAVELLDLARLVTGLDRGLLILRSRREPGSFEVAATRGLPGPATPERAVLDRTARQVLKSGPPALDLDPRAARDGLIAAVPIDEDGERLGVLVLHGPTRDTPLTAAERCLLRAFARQAALRLRKAEPAPAPASPRPAPKPRALSDDDRRALLRKVLTSALRRSGGHLPTLARITKLPEERARALLEEVGLRPSPSGWGGAALA